MGGMSVVRVLLVDDFEPFRKFACGVLKGRPELQVICEASDGEEAVLKARELQPDLILMDIGLPKLNGIEAARRILRSSPQSKILFVSQESSVEVVQAALDTGACGYLAKADAGSELLGAVDSVLRSCRFVSARLGPILI